MKFSFAIFIAVGGALAGTLRVCEAETITALSPSNFVEVGDSVSEVLDTSGLAFSTMLMDPTNLDGQVRGANFVVPASAPAARAQVFRKTCPGGGSVQINVLDADNSGDLSTSDRFRLNFGACSIGGDTVSGRSEFVVSAHRFEGTSEITELDFRFDRLGSTAMRWTGKAHAALKSDLQRGTESYVVTYHDMTVTRGAQTMRWNFSVDMVRPPIGDQVASVQGAMTVDGLLLHLQQDEPFVIAASGHPSSGQITARDPNGARLQIEGQRRRYAYRFFSAKNAGDVADSASQSKALGGR